jgi:lipopolysaccharide export system protein LptA
LKSKRKGARKPTKITSQSLDADMGKNIIIFTGDVFVDDDDMTINCHKMTIYLEDKKPGKEAPEKKEEPESPEKAAAGKKQLEKIICEKDVVIVRKVVDPDAKAKGRQKAESGRAVYDVKLGEIELTEDNPRLSRGEEVISADKITIWRNRQSARFEGNVTTTFQAMFDDGKKPEKEPVQPAEREENSNQTHEGIVPFGKPIEDKSAPVQEKPENKERKKYSSRIYRPDRGLNSGRDDVKKSKPTETSIQDILKDGHPGSGEAEENNDGSGK